MKRMLLAAAAVAVAFGCERKAGRIGAIPFGVDAGAALAQGKAEGKPVFIEFWADD